MYEYESTGKTGSLRAREKSSYHHSPLLLSRRKMSERPAKPPKPARAGKPSKPSKTAKTTKPTKAAKSTNASKPAKSAKRPKGRDAMKNRGIVTESS